MLIEFVGPSGAGKSSVAQQLAESAKGVAIETDELPRHIANDTLALQTVSLLPSRFNTPIIERVWRNRLKYEYANRFIAGHPEILGTAELLIQHWDRDPGTIARIFEKMAIRQVFREGDGTTANVILDDNLLQSLLNILVVQEALAVEDLFVDGVLKPDVLIAVVAPAERCYERQCSRSRGLASMYRNMDREDVIAKIERCREATMQIPRVLNDEDVDIVLFDNTADGPAKLDDLLAVLQERE